MIPQNSSQTHLMSNCTDTIINIALRRSPTLGSDTSGLFDGLESPIKLCNNLGISLGCHGRMGPGVDTEMMPIVQTALSSSRIAMLNQSISFVDRVM